MFVLFCLCCCFTHFWQPWIKFSLFKQIFFVFKKFCIPSSQWNPVLENLTSPDVACLPAYQLSLEYVRTQLKNHVLHPILMNLFSIFALTWHLIIWLIIWLELYEWSAKDIRDTHEVKITPVCEYLSDSVCKWHLSCVNKVCGPVKVLFNLQACFVPSLLSYFLYRGG